MLVTGAARQLGGRFVRRIQRDPGVDRVIAVDAVAPGHGLGDADFVTADIRQPAIARVLAEHSVDTVVHLDVSAKSVGTGGRTTVKETNVIGTMQLLGACQKAPSVRRLVVKSSTNVYGSAPRDPAVFTETTPPKSLPSGASPRTRWRSRGTYGASRAAGRMWLCACSDSRTSSDRRPIRRWPTICRCLCCRRCSDTTRGSSSCTRTMSSTFWASRPVSRGAGR